jgi:hypothetical protein
LTYPLGDNKRLSFPQAAPPDWYAQSTLVPIAPNGLGSTTTTTAGTFGYVSATGQTTTNGYRLDPVHANRGLFTTRSYDLDRPKLVPNFGSNSFSGLQLTTTTTNGVTTNKPGTLNASGVLSISPGSYPSPQTPPTYTDFAPSTGTANPSSQTNFWVNAMSALGSVNVNRPLADYRDLTAAMNQPTPQPLSTNNLGNYSKADSDRQQLARDIFTRFVAALGGAATVNTSTGTYTIPATVTPGSPQFNALRYLAQVAVNVVDYIDNDDISTTFIWNPNTTGNTPVMWTSATDIDTRVVFGVERSRLVINEAYSEVTNDPSTTPPTLTAPVPTTANANVRFWVELLNPSTSPVTGSLLNDGSVPLNAYKLEIARATRNTGVPMAQQGNLAAYLTDPANSTGRFGQFNTSFTPDISFALSGGAVTTVAPNVTTAAPNGTYAPAALPTSGFLLVGPNFTSSNTIEFAPTTIMGSPWANAQNTLMSGAAAASPGSNSMAYTIPIQTDGFFANTEFKRNVVLLRRTANPYQTPNDPLSSTYNAMNPTNPYITVDMMDYVPSFDAVTYGSGDIMIRQPFPANNGYDPATSRFSVGKVQPYAGHASATVTAGSGKYNSYTFPNSMVLNQTATNNNQPNHTFGRHNGKGATQAAGSTFTAGNPTAMPATQASLSGDTIMQPFDWLVHMDRPVVNPIELFQVRDTQPHRVTDLFLTAPATPTAPGVAYHTGIANWRDVYSGIGRGVEFLSIKPYTSGVPHGGRVAGRVGLNATQDQRIIQGLFDPQPANAFDLNNYVKPVAWSQWMNSRNAVETRTLADGATQINRSGAASATVHDNPTSGTDQPFMTLGAPASDAFPAGTNYPFAYSAGSMTDQWSILRRPAQASPPYLYLGTSTGTSTYSASLTGLFPNNFPFPPSQPNGPAYYQSEPVRKMFNNSTTVCQQYMVIMTVGYFQVVGSVSLGNGLTIPQLGPEAFVSIPGDTRQQMVAVVDMSNMAIKPLTTLPDSSDPSNTNWQFGEYSNGRRVDPPFYTSLEATTYPSNTAQDTLTISYDRYDGTYLYIAADGVEVPIVPSSSNPMSPLVATQLVIGTGADRQVVLVQSITGATGNQATVIVTGIGNNPTTALTKTAWAGSCVSNAIPGYPGPQPNFRYDDPAYAPVVPYIERLK